MAKKIELLNDQQEVVHPLTSADCVIMENGETLDKVMGDGIATPTITHEGTSFQVGVGDSNIEVVDSDVAGMTIKGQSYQNILPKPTTLIMETDEKEFKINDKIDSNIIIDDNIAEIATVKGKTIVNAVQEESGSEYTVLGEDLSGQGEIVTENTVDGNIKGVTLQGQTLVNTIQEPCKDSYVVLGADDGIEISAETGGCGTIEDTIGGSIKSAILSGQTLVNVLPSVNDDRFLIKNSTTLERLKDGFLRINAPHNGRWEIVTNTIPIKPSTKYLLITEVKNNTLDGLITLANITGFTTNNLTKVSVGFNGVLKQIITTKDVLSDCIFQGWLDSGSNGFADIRNTLIEYQDGMENWDIPYFEGMQSVNLYPNQKVSKITWKSGLYYDSNGELVKPNAASAHKYFDEYIEIHPNHVYTISGNNNYKNLNFYDANKNLVLRVTGTSLLGDGSLKDDIYATAPTNAKYIRYNMAIGSDMDEGTTIFDTTLGIPLMKTDIDETYFHKMPVLKTVGKNLFDETQYITKSGKIVIDNNYIRFNENVTGSVHYYLNFQKNITYYISHFDSSDTTNNSALRYRIYDDSTGEEILSWGIWDRSFKINESKKLRIQFSRVDALKTEVTASRFVISQEKESQYIPYKSNILTVNEEVELRGIGDVKDELDLITGKLTQRIGEIVFDGSKDEQWEYNKDYDVFANKDYVVSNGNYIFTGIGELSIITWNGILRYALSPSKYGITSLETGREYLANNPINIQYRLAKKSVKTIDLTVTDQDGNTIPHIQTQPTVTHITASSDYLIPTVTIDDNLAYDIIIKPSTLYTVRFKHDTVNTDNSLTVDLGGTVQTVTSTEFTITTPSTLTHNQLVFSGKNNVVSEVQVIEGDVTSIEYPFFEGMNDVKFSDSKFIGRGRNIWKWGDLLDVGVAEITVNLEPGEYWFSCNSSITYDSRPVVVFFDENLVQIAYGFADASSYYNLPIKTRMIYIYSNGYSYQNSSTNLTSFTNIMLTKEHHVKANYEPYRCVEVQQDIDSIPLTTDMFEQGYYDYNHINGYSLQQMVKQDSDIRLRSKTLIPVKPNSRYILNNDAMYLWCLAFDKDGLYLGYRVGTIGETIVSEFTTDSFTHFIVPVIFNSAKGDGNTPPSNLSSMNLVLQEVPQEIVLRGIGDVKDELDLTRGEYIQRIGEATITGYENYNWNYGEPSNGWNQNGEAKAFFSLGINEALFENKKMGGECKCNKMCTIKGAYIVVDLINHDVFGLGHTDYVVIRKTGISTQEELKAWLQQNPITIQYELATPIIHKVNLTNSNKIPSYASKTTYATQQPQDSLIPNITIPSTLNYDVAIKPSTEYTIRANTSDNLTVDLGGTTGTLSNGKVTLTTPTTLTHNEVKFSGTGKVKELMVVEGSEIKDNVPFFNGMKDVQMGGIKLVNIARGAVYNENVLTANANKTQFTYTSDGSHWGVIRFDDTLLKPNSVYTLCMNIVSNNLDVNPSIKVCYGVEAGSGYTTFAQNITGIQKIKITTIDNPTNNALYIGLKPCTVGQQVVIQNPMIIEGDWTHLDEIPYIESEMIIEQPIIRSQGKNLFNVYSEKELSCFYSATEYGLLKPHESVDTYTVKIEPNTTYTLSCNGASMSHLTYWDASMSYVGAEVEYGDTNLRTITTPNRANYVKIPIHKEGITNIQLEEGATATSYKAYRHHTLYSNRVIGYEENCYYIASDGTKKTNNTALHSVKADVEGLSVAYVTKTSSNYVFWDKNGVFISGKATLDTAGGLTDKDGFITVPSNAKYMTMAVSNKDVNRLYTDTTVTGDLPLRSLPNGVCDTLNLVTGEYVQRVGEIVLDGSQQDSYWLYNETNKTFRIQISDAFVLQNSAGDANRNRILVSSDRLVSRKYSDDWNSGTFITLALDKRIVVRIDGITKTADLQDYLKQNPITVQYELATPIVRKLEFTAKGNYREQVLDGSETWAMDAIDNTKTVRMTKKTTSPLQNPLYDTVLFTDDYHVRAKDENHGTYEYITCIGNGIYISIYQSKVNELSVQGCTQWLSHNPIKVGYITSAQSSESYSNIHKPIFFNNVKVQYLPNNVGIQPQLTLQARTRNSYVMDMMKPNTTYTMKCLTYSNNTKLYAANSTTNTSVTSNKTFQIAKNHLDGSKNELVLVGQWYEPMIIEGDVTGKNLPYFKGILSSYHDVDEVEVYSYNSENHNTTRIEMPTRLETVKVVRPVIESGSVHTTTGESFDKDDAPIRNVRTSYIPVEPNEMIKFYNGNDGRAVNVFYYDIDKQFIGFEYYDGTSARPTTPKNCYFVRMYCGKSACDDITFVRSTYKPIQLNSLPNGVYDEIIMKPNSNKAQLVQRVGKVVLDGSENYGIHEVWSRGDIVCANVYVLDKQVGSFAYGDRFEGLKAQEALDNTNMEVAIAIKECIRYNASSAVLYLFINKARLGDYGCGGYGIKEYLKDNPLTVYYQCNPVTHEIQLQGYPHVYENGTVTLNTDTPHQTLVSYNVNQEQLINTQNETIIRHDQQIDDLYYYIELYLEEIYQMELFRMQVELSL